MIISLKHLLDGFIRRYLLSLGVPNSSFISRNPIDLMKQSRNIMIILFKYTLPTLLMILLMLIGHLRETRNRKI
jgi:hypothetical protein